MATIFPDRDIFDIESYNEDVITVSGTFTIPDEEMLESKIDIGFKAKIDNWSIDKDNKVITLNDLKTTGKPVETFGGQHLKSIEVIGPFEIVPKTVFEEGSFQKFHYYRQMAMYAFILWKYCEKQYGVKASDGWKMNVNMVVIESNAPHNCRVFRVSKRWIDYGKSEFLELSKRVAYHRMFGFDKHIDFSNDIFANL
jgi:hypothetical protein